MVSWIIAIRSISTSYPLWLIVAILAGMVSPAYAQTLTSTTAFEYNAVTGLVTKKIIEPDKSYLCLVAEYTYDNYGNKLTTTNRNCNGSSGANPGVNSEAVAPPATNAAFITPRSIAIGYDAQGRFPLTGVNPINQSASQVLDNRFGVVTSRTDLNNLVSSWQYDGFGSLLAELHPDNTSVQTTYAMCDSSCPVSAKYKVTNTQAGYPTNTLYYDMYDRIIQSDTQDKDGAIVYTRAEYDHLGRIGRVSRPAKIGQALVWTTLDYDQLDRVKKTTMPDSSATTKTYNGLSTVTTNALNQSETEQMNSQGQIVSVTDAYGKVLSYQYDPLGNLIKTTDVAGNVTTLSYDIRGRKLAMEDPDQGLRVYAYDVLGQLKQQLDAKGQVVTFTYDKLGRVTQRNEPDLISTWGYDACVTGNSQGKCIGKLVSETSDNGSTRSYSYDNYGRMNREAYGIDGSYGFMKSFDNYGRVSQLMYSNGTMIYNTYSTTGYLTEVRNAANGALYWRTDTTDAVGNVTKETYGNGVVTTRNYNTNTGLLTQMNVGTSISNQSFVYDSIGNLKQRFNGVTDLNESFGYDKLNRLIATNAAGGINTPGNISTSVTLTYDDIGNITYKSDIGTYAYGVMVNGIRTKPHAVSKITKNDGITDYASYSYDANGNNSSGYGRNITWNSWDMPASITKDNAIFSFVYNGSHERVKEQIQLSSSDIETIYNISPRLDTGLHVEKRVRSSGTQQYMIYLYAGQMPFGTLTETSYIAPGATTPTSTTSIRYFHTDHLGSIIAITKEDGTVLESRSYDAWGKRRNLNGTSLTGAISTAFERHGYTSHEQLDEVGIVHMNGRLYDAAINRFMSVDPVIQYPLDMQSYNAYSYLTNNSMNSTDPSGFEENTQMLPEVTVNSSRISAGFFSDDGWGSWGYGGSGSQYVGNNVPIGYSAFGSWMNPDGKSVPPSVVIKPSHYGLMGSGKGLLSKTTQKPDDKVISMAIPKVSVDGEFDKMSPLDKYGTPWDDIPFVGIGTIGVRALVKALSSKAVIKGIGIIAQDGAKITGLTKHGVDRVIGDGASRAGTRPEAILDALKNPTEIKEGVDSLGRPYKIYTGENARVVVNPSTGNIVSTNPLSAAGAHLGE